jgi:hypothetical protein
VLVAVLWIRVRIGSGFNQVSGSGIRIRIQGAKMTREREEIQFFDLVDVLYIELKDSPVICTFILEAQG